MASKYLTLAAELRDELLSHRQDPSYHLPTEMKLTQKYGVSRQTVRQALSLLQNEGLIIRRQGSGTYAAPSAPAVPDHLAAVILPDTQSYMHPAILQDVQTFFNGKGYSVRIFTSNRLFEREREILESLIQSPVAVLLVKGFSTALPTPNFDLYQKLREMGTAIAFFGGIHPNLSSILRVSGDNFSGGWKLASHLIGCGHRSIGGIFPKDDQEGAERYLGCISAIRKQRQPFRDQNFFWYNTVGYDQASFSRFNHIQAFISHLSGSCTAVICHNDETAYFLIQTLLQQGIRVPEDLTVASFDHSYLSELTPMGNLSLAYAGQKPWIAAASLLLDSPPAGEPFSRKLPWT